MSKDRWVLSKLGALAQIPEYDRRNWEKELSDFLAAIQKVFPISGHLTAEGEDSLLYLYPSGRSDNAFWLRIHPEVIGATFQTLLGDRVYARQCDTPEDLWSELESVLYALEFRVTLLRMARAK